MDRIYDVLIVGAGPAGSAAAYYLAKEGIDVLVLDKAEFPRHKTCGDGLTPRALNILREMGLLDEVHHVGYRISGIELHGRKGNTMMASIPEHQTYPDHMVIAPRFRLDDLLRQHAMKSGALFHGSTRVQEIEKKLNNVLVHARHKEGKRTYQGRVVLLAVGAATRLLNNAGILERRPQVIRAARGYFQGVQGLNEHVQAHFEHVPLPGYGWVFPIAADTANVGMGYWSSLLPWKKTPDSARSAMRHWLQTSDKMRNLLQHAQLTDGIKSFPLRVDFTNNTVQKGRVLLIGEAAGLTNPLTGEGIDLALESGKLAAEYLVENAVNQDYSIRSLSSYEGLLRQNFQKLFICCQYLRQLYLNPFLMNRAILATRKFPELKDTLVRIMLGQVDADALTNLATLRKVILLR